MIIAVQKVEQAALTQSLKVGSQEGGRQAEPLARHRRPISHISNTCIAKTIANCALPPEHIPKAIEERHFFRSLAPRPFFSKHRKLADLSRRDQREQRELREQGRPLRGNSSDGCMLTGDFTQMLKAKSTVIKQKKLQEFYISREGRQREVQPSENFRSNLFKPYFPKKSHKLRRNSFYLEKSFKVTESLEVPADHLRLCSRNAHSFADTHPIDDDFRDKEDCVLREKQTINAILNKISSSKPGSQAREKPRRRWREKENQLEFELEPWGSFQPEDSFF